MLHYSIILRAPLGHPQILHFCYTSLLIFNISPFGASLESSKIINFCNTSLLKLIFSILQENAAITKLIKNHTIIEKRNHQKTIGISLQIDQPRPQNSPQKIKFSSCFFNIITKMLVLKMLKKHKDFH